MIWPWLLRHRIALPLLLLSILSASNASSLLRAQSSPPPDPVSVYRQLQNSSTIDKAVRLENATLQRDRVSITFRDGLVYLSPPVEGKIRAGVFIGSGDIQATPPNLPFEQNNVRRLLKADDVASNFRTAVLRFTDDTANELIKQGSVQGATTSEQANRLAAEFEPQLLKETGMNVSSRQLESILNQETPGIFLIQLDGGKRGRFTYLFDPQSRIPVKNFGIDAGEKGLIFAYDQDIFFNDVWMAFNSLGEYSSGIANYSDAYNLVDTRKYTMTLDLTEPKKVLGLKADVDLVSRADNLRFIDFAVGESLSIYDDERRKKQLHILSAHLSDGTPLAFFQESWEGGFGVVLPKAVAAGQSFSLSLELKGDFMMESPRMERTYFPRSTETWYPRHGHLTRSVYDISMVHRKKDRVVSVGEFVNEGPAPESKDDVVTQFRMLEPIALASFAVGPYEIHRDVAKQQSGKQLPVEFYSMPGDRAAIKEDFILAEMSNCVRFFSQTFGEYPYSLFRGVYHPFNFGQGFATTIMIPATDRADFYTYSFIAHETSHQWWGDQVLWRSYRDQWLSEGFAEYSGMLYAQTRDKTKSEKELIRLARADLKIPPHTRDGIGKGRLVDVGPLIMGQRVESRETRGAYTALTYKKGALVLRMLHFLFTDPQTGDGQAFFDLMRDFVKRYNGKTASTEQFFAMASERVKKTPLAAKFGYTNLDWFYHQWVTETHLPTYELSYHIEQMPDGTHLKGDVSQLGLPDDDTWVMPIPLIFFFADHGMARTTVLAKGAHAAINIKLPKAPEKVELDPEMWVLSDKTSTKKE